MGALLRGLQAHLQCWQQQAATGAPAKEQDAQLLDRVTGSGEQLHGHVPGHQPRSLAEAQQASAAAAAAAVLLLPPVVPQAQQVLQHGTASVPRTMSLLEQQRAQLLLLLQAAPAPPL